MSKIKEPFSQGQKIKFDFGSTTGIGTVVGIVTAELPIIGYQYIIEPEISIGNFKYPYTHFAAFSNQLEIYEN